MVSKKQSYPPAFTIVELLVVIVVIGILAAITIVSYTGITSKANASALRSDLANASNQLKMYQIDHSAYPTSLNASNCPLDSLSVVDNAYCLKSTSGNSFLYSANNNSSPQTFSLYAINTSINTKYRTTDSSSPTIATPVVATGGTITNVGGYRIHTFTTGGTFTVTSGDNVEVLVVGGGGGGGSSQLGSGGGGGGGAGGLIYNTSFSITAGQTLVVNIGNGGAPGAPGLHQSGSNGENSIFGSITAIGGGFGARPGQVGGIGGSGGGGGYNGYVVINYGGSGILGQGSAGGNTSLLAWAGGAGGGGAGGIGGDNKSDHGGGDKGVGLVYSISGNPITYAAGGSGGANSLTASPANSGKGGDAAYSTGTSYAGGSGIVIIRYPN